VFRLSKLVDDNRVMISGRQETGPFNFLFGWRLMFLNWNEQYFSWPWIWW
jgi:hypothetical protein